jgi:uncharacterized protein involved in exopolysaccharide biosynthesis
VKPVTEMESSSQPSVVSNDFELGVGDVVGVLRARAWLIIVVAVMVSAAAVLSAARQEPTYSSMGSVVVATTAQNSGQGTQLLATDKELARSRAVATLAAKQLRSKESVDDLRAKVSVSVPHGTHLLQFRATAATEGAAERLTDAFLSSYVRYKGQLLDDMVSATSAIDKRTDALRLRVADAEAAAADAPTPEARAAARDAIASLTSEINTLDQQRTRLLDSVPAAATIADNASPGKRDQPPLKRTAVVGFIAGLVLGAALAYVLEHFKKRRQKTALIGAGGEPSPNAWNRT